MGYTFSPFWEEVWDAVEGVFGDGRKASIRWSATRWGVDGGAVQGVRNLSLDRVQDLRSLPGMRRARADRPEPTSVLVYPSTPLSSGELHPLRQARASQLGRAQDQRAPGVEIFRYQDPRQK